VRAEHSGTGSTVEPRRLPARQTGPLHTGDGEHAFMLYRRLGRPDALEPFVSPDGHELSDEMGQRAYHWFDRWL